MIVVAQSTSIEDAQDLLDAGTRPWQALLLQNLLTDQRAGASWGVMGRHGVAKRVGKLQLGTSFGFIVFHSRTPWSYVRVYSRLFSNVWGTCFKAKTEVEAGCLQHGRLLATCHGVFRRFHLTAALRSPESLHLTLPPGDPIASLVAVWR